MKKKNWIALGIGGIVLAGGVVLTVLTRAAAIAEDAAAGAKLPFALGLILILCGFLTGLVGVLPEKKPANVRTLSMAALFAALCYIGFTYCKIDIPVGMEILLSTWVMCSAYWLRCSWAVSGAVCPARWV